MPRSVLLLSAAALALTPAAAQQGGRQINPRDVAEAQRDHPEIVRELGGAETGPRAAYVESVGRRVSAFSGIANPGQALRFTTLNSPVENALSVPGGYVYVTRQLMAIMDDESQLAFALGHEVGHIAANHARAREAYAQRNNWLGVLGQVLGAAVGINGIGDVISQRSRLQTLSFSRDQEYQSDTLGMRYMVAAGYDPAGAAGVLGALSRASALQTRVQGRSNRQAPEWALTHPLSENRRQRALAAAQASGRLGTGVRNRDGFLAQLNGAYFDDDPAQGVIDGASFIHPDLRIQFTVPQGYRMSNGTSAVSVAGSTGKAQFSGGRFSGPLDAYIMRVFQELTQGQIQVEVPPPQRTTINGLPTAFTTARVRSQSGVIDVTVVAYQWDAERVYHFITITPGGSAAGAFAPMINSVRKISVAEAAAIRPRVIEVTTVRPSDTVQSLAARMAYRDFRLERFLALNGLVATSPLRPGQKVKVIVYGQRRA